MRKIALILAGGKGTRLWPLSRENYPKQFVQFQNGLSLFQLTLKRTLCYFKASHIYIISSDSYKFTVFNQIDGLNTLTRKAKSFLKDNLILEPCSKNTAPAVLLSIKFIENKINLDNNDVMFVFPSDHVIEPVSKFTRALDIAFNICIKDYIVVFGIRPTCPKEGYGYILVKEKLDRGYRVLKFVEKPTLSKSKSLLDKGAFWNAGIFSFKKKVFLEELKRYKPGIYRYYSLSYGSLVSRFSQIIPESIDYAIMQKTRRASLVEFNLKWSDLGSWDSFLDFKSKEEYGHAELIDSNNCFVYSKQRQACIIGLNDIIVVDSPDSLLIVKKGLSDKVKQLVEILNKKNKQLVEDSLTVYRPWGYYTILVEEKNYKVKEIGVYPKKSISLQKHTLRSEHWNVVEGRAEIILGNKKTVINKNESVFVPKGKLHKVYNPTDKTVKIIEVQIGSYLGEDDIKRFDRY